MIVLTKYRGQVTEVANCNCRFFVTEKGQVSAVENHWTDGNKKITTVYLEPHELVDLIKSASKALKSIAPVSTYALEQLV